MAKILLLKITMVFMLATSSTWAMNNEDTGRDTEESSETEVKQTTKGINLETMGSLLRQFKNWWQEINNEDEEAQIEASLYGYYLGLFTIFYDR